MKLSKLAKGNLKSFLAAMHAEAQWLGLKEEESTLAYSTRTFVLPQSAILPRGSLMNCREAIEALVAPLVPRERDGGDDGDERSRLLRTSSCSVAPTLLNRRWLSQVSPRRLGPLDCFSASCRGFLFVAPSPPKKDVVRIRPHAVDSRDRPRHP